MKEIISTPPVRSFDIFLGQVKRAIGNGAVDLMEKRLRKIYRWGYIPGVPDKFESDWEHIEEMFDNHDNMVARVPEVLNFIHRPTLFVMFLGHDLPETVVGDLSHQNPDYETLQPIYKRNEDRAMAKIVGLFSYVNPEKMALLREQGVDPLSFNRRFEAHPDGDREALLAKYHDYEQAITKALQHGLFNTLNDNTSIKTVDLARKFIEFIPWEDVEVREKLRAYFKDKLKDLGELTDSL